MNFTIRTLSELGTDTAEDAELLSLSTSNPLLVFGLSTHTISEIAHVVTWALQTANALLGLKKGLADLKAHFPQADASAFEEALQARIEAAVELEVTRLVALHKPDAARSPAEMQGFVRRATEYTYSQVERGMTISVHLPEDMEDDAIEQRAMQAVTEYHNTPRLPEPNKDPTPLIGYESTEG